MVDAGRLAGKVTMVTGAAHGIGEAIGRRFAAEGATVWLADVDGPSVRRVADEITAVHGVGVAQGLQLDVASEREWASAMATVVAEGQGLDVLVNNAGIVHHASLEDCSLVDYEHSVGVNQVGTFLGLRAAIGPMRAGGGGSIVNMSSVRGLVGATDLAAYVSTKFAVTGLTKVAALELGPDGIRVNSIHPSAVATRLVGDAGEEASAAYVSNQPITRMGRPEEIASLALFLASDESSYCTGSAFVVDGGATAGVRRPPHTR